MDDSNQNSLHMSSNYQYHSQQSNVNAYLWLESTNGYLDMTCGKTSPRIGKYFSAYILISTRQHKSNFLHLHPIGYHHKPEPVISYLVDDEDEARHLGVHSRVLRSRSPADQQPEHYEYVEMCPRALSGEGDNDVTFEGNIALAGSCSA